MVKWYNPEKGFGFVEMGDGSGDAFLHASAVERVGAGPPVPGTRLRVRVGQGQKGRQITEITHVGEVGPAPAQPPRSPRPAFGGGGGYGGGYAPRDRDPYQGMPSGEEITGTVKWFNAQKGFGFITPEIRRQGCIRPHLRALAQRHERSARGSGGARAGRAGPKGAGGGLGLGAVGPTILSLQRACLTHVVLPPRNWQASAGWGFGPARALSRPTRAPAEGARRATSPARPPAANPSRAGSQIARRTANGSPRACANAAIAPLSRSIAAQPVCACMRRLSAALTAAVSAPRMQGPPPGGTPP